MARYQMGASGPQLRKFWLSYKAPRSSEGATEKTPAHFIEQIRKMDGEEPAKDDKGKPIYIDTPIGANEVIGGVLEKPFELVEQKTSKDARAKALSGLVVDGTMSQEEADSLRDNWALDDKSGVTPSMNIKMSLVDAEAGENYIFTIPASSWSAYHFAARLGQVMPGDMVDIYAYNVKSRNAEGGSDSQGIGIKHNGEKLTPAHEVCYYPSEDGLELLPRINQYEGDTKVSSALPTPAELGPQSVKVGNRTVKLEHGEWIAPVRAAVNRTVNVFIQQQYAHLQQQQETQGQAQGEASADETETAPRPR